MNPYRIITDGKWFKIQEQTGWFWKRWVDYPYRAYHSRLPPIGELGGYQPNKFCTMEEAEDKIRTLCQGSKWKVVKTFNTCLDDMLWSEPPPMPACSRPRPSPPPPPRQVGFMFKRNVH